MSHCGWAHARIIETSLSAKPWERNVMAAAPTAGGDLDNLDPSLDSPTTRRPIIVLRICSYWLGAGERRGEREGREGVRGLSNYYTNIYYGTKTDSHTLPTYTTVQTCSTMQTCDTEQYTLFYQQMLLHGVLLRPQVPKVGKILFRS